MSLYFSLFSSLLFLPLPVSHSLLLLPSGAHVDCPQQCYFWNNISTSLFPKDISAPSPSLHNPTLPPLLNCSQSLFACQHCPTPAPSKTPAALAFEVTRAQVWVSHIARLPIADSQQDFCCRNTGGFQSGPLIWVYNSNYLQFVVRVLRST